MRLMGTAEDPADSLGQLIGAEQLIGLYHLALGVDPHRLYRVQPRALLGKKADDDAYPQAGLSDLAIVGRYPVSDEFALVPACVVPDQQQSLFAHSGEFVAAPRKKLCGDGTHGPPLHEPQPHPLLPSSSLGFASRVLRAHQHPVSTERFRIGIVLGWRVLYQAWWLPILTPAVEGRPLEATPPRLIAEPKSPLGVGLGQCDQPVSIPFLRAYSGSGLSIQPLARCQLLPRRSKVARTVSPVTLFWVIPSSKLTSAAIASVHQVLCLPNSLGERCKSSCRASRLPSAPKAAWVRFGREEPAMRASRPRRLKSWMALRTVWEVHPRLLAILCGLWPRELARSIWARRRAKASLERRAILSDSRSSSESEPTKIGGFMRTTISHN